MTTLVGTIRILALLVAAQTGPASGSAAAPDDRDVRRLLHDLSSPVWKTRDDATSALMGKGPELYEPLRSEFKSAAWFDTRRRIKEIAKEIFLTDKLGPPAAFLGISHNRSDLRNIEDARIPPGCTALRVETVFLGTSAERAGLKPGDLLLAMNGKKASIDDPATNMTKWIAAQKPGTPCRLGIIRGGEGVRLELGRRGSLANRLSHMNLEVVPAGKDPLVPDGGVGLRITEEARIEEGPALRAGDLIIAMNDQRLPADDSLNVFRSWIISAAKNAGRADDSEETEIRIVNGVPQAVPRGGGPTLQVIRGGRWLEIDARLGRRPGFLRGSTSSPWPADPSKIERATSEFETWWTDTFDPSGDFAEQASGDPLWRLEPARR